MIQIIGYIILTFYISGVLLFLRLGFSHESGEKEPKYAEAAIISIAWPVLFLSWLYYRSKQNS